MPVRRPFLAALALLAVLAAFPAAPAHARTQASRSLDFRIVIPAILRVAILEAPKLLRVPVAEGAASVTPESATVVRLQNNCRGGVSLAAELVDAEVERVQLEFDGRTLEVGAGGATAAIPFWGMQPRDIRVHWRVELKPGARAGERPWPVALRFSNCA